MKKLATAILWISLSGCSTITIENSVLMNSSVTHDEVVRAGISTTGEAIGEVLKAAGLTVQPIDLDSLRAILEEYRMIRSQAR